MKRIVCEEIFEKRVITYHCNNLFDIQVTKEKNIQTDIKLVYKDVDIIKLDGYEPINLSNCFLMYLPNKEQFYKDVKEKHYATIMQEFHGDSFNYKKYINKLFELDTKSEDFILCYNSGHLFFDHIFNPISYSYTLDYIGQLSQSYRKSPLWKELVNKLKTHPYISNVKLFDVPYYNSKFDGQRGVESLNVYVPQEEYVKIFEHIKANPTKPSKYNNHISSEVGEIIKMQQYGYDGIYPLYGFEELLIEQNKDNYETVEETNDE